MFVYSFVVKLFVCLAVQGNTPLLVGKYTTIKNLSFSAKKIFYTIRCDDISDYLAIAYTQSWVKYYLEILNTKYFPSIWYLPLNSKYFRCI